MKFKLPKIPQDEDAAGIVIKVLSFEYYLKPFWLTFIDPYIEVEYQISTRRIRLEHSIYLSILMMLHGVFIFIYPMLVNISDNPNKTKYKKICYIFGILIIITSLIQILIPYIKSINKIFNWPLLYIIKNSITYFIFYFIMIDDIYNIEYHTNLSPTSNAFIKYMYIFDTEISHTMSIFIMTLFIMTIYSILVLNIQQFLILSLGHSMLGGIFIYRYQNSIKEDEFYTNL